MKYAEVTYMVDGDNYIHGAIYYGVTDTLEAANRFLKEFPNKKDVAIHVKIHR